MAVNENENIEIVKLQIRRGLEAEMPILDEGEPGLVTDKKKVAVGDGTENIYLANEKDLKEISDRLADKASQADVTAAVEPKADKTYVDGELAKKPDKEYIDTKTQGVSLAYKESYATLADLQAAYPTGDAFNHAVLADGMIYTWINDTWTNTQIQANGTGIADKSITPEKTSFMRPSKNLFKGNYRTGFMASNGGYRSDGVNGRMAVLEIEPNKTYTIKIHQPRKERRFGVSILTKEPIFTETYQNPHKLIVFDPTLDEITFTNTDQGRYLLVYVSGSDSEPKMQIEEGSVATEYTSGNPQLLPIYAEEVEGRLKTNTVEKIKDFISIGKNKFDGNYTEGIFVGIVPATVAESSTTNSRSAVVPLEKGKTYTLRKYKGGDRLRIAVVDKYPSKDVLPLTSLYHLVVDNGEEEYTHTFTNNYGTNEINYLVVYTNAQETETPLLQVEEGSIATEYEGFEFKYLGKPLTLGSAESGNEVMSRDANFFVLDDIQGIYQAPDLPSVAPGEPFDLRASVHTDIYSIYDALTTENSSYITKTLLGNDTVGNPIYQYHFVPSSANSDIKPKRPKLILLSGVHGDEKMSVWGLCQFLKDMCNNWRSNNILEYIRWNFELVVVPMCNPSGYDLNTRQNANGVDINRNLPIKNWRPLEEPGNLNYSGPSPSSEIETQVLVDMYTNHLDADYSIDYHNFFQHDGYIMWSPTKVTENKLLAMNVMSTMSRKWKKQFPAFPQDDSILGFVNTTNSASTSSYSYELGMKSMTLEIVRQIQYGTDSKYFDKTTTLCAVELIGNLLAGIGKSVR